MAKGLTYLMLIDGNSGSTYFSTYGLTVTDTYINLTYEVGQWYHLAFSWDGADKVVYRNGVLVKTQAAAGTINTKTDNLLIGRFFSYYWEGNIALAKIYNRALSVSEIRAQFNQEKHLFA
jgi:hypothetical protein